MKCIDGLLKCQLEMKLNKDKLLSDYEMPNMHLHYSVHFRVTQSYFMTMKTIYLQVKWQTFFT